MVDNIRTPFSRVFLIENRAGPAHPSEYQGQVKLTGPSWSLGDRTPVRIPDPNRYGAFKIVDAIKGERGLPTATLETRYQYTISEFLRLARVGCPLDVQVHFGKCQDPRDPNDFDKILVLENADASNLGLGDLGALDQGEDAIVSETLDINAFDMYEVMRLSFEEVGATEIVQEVVAVQICDSVQCGLCGVPSNGCQVFFALTMSAGGSPGLSAELIYSRDGGSTLGQTNITTLAANEDPDDMECVGTRLVVVSNESGSIHYALIADILGGGAVDWAEIATGLVIPTGRPNAIFSLGATQSWIVGDGGYIYFSSDITAGVTPQISGGATVQNLNDIQGYDDQNLLAVGNSNVVLLTRNGGESWQLITGPAVGVALSCCWMHTADEWFVGTANGRLWYTRDAGVTWTEKVFNGSGAGQVRDIVFATPTVGYLAHDTAASVGRILRTVDGGQTWYVLPEGTASFPDNDRINQIAACAEDPNRVYAGGLGANSTDGILLIGA